MIPQWLEYPIATSETYDMGYTHQWWCNVDVDPLNKLPITDGFIQQVIH